MHFVPEVMKSGARIVFCALLLGIVAVPNLPAQIYVDINTGSDERTGLDDWTNAVATISNGVLRATQHAQNTVLVATGRYYLVSNIVVSSAITLRSWNNGALDRENTIVDGQGQTRCLYLVNTNATVAGFTFTGGNGAGNVSDKYGGGVYNAGGVLSNCLVLFNSASERGGGVYLGHLQASAVKCDVKYNKTIGGFGGGGVFFIGAGMLLDSVVAFNTNMSSGSGSGGGGVYVREGSTPANYKIDGCVISNNYSIKNAGGVCVYYGCPIISSNIISSNRTDGDGGGVYYYMVNKGAVFAHNTVAGNSATNGGGLYIWPNMNGLGGILVTNCTIRGNTASKFGGGVMTSIGNTNYVNTTIILTDSVIDNNQALNVSPYAGFTGGGGVYWDAAGRMEKCIITNNYTGATGGGLYLRRRYALSSSGTNEALIVRNCLVSSNQATIGGGAFCYQIAGDKPVFLENCTVAGNLASNYAGGLWFYDSAQVTLTNTIAYNNTALDNLFADDINIRMEATSYKLGNCCLFPTNHLNLLDGLIAVTTNDPLFAAREAMEFQLAAGSPCVNAGTNYGWMNDGLDLGGRPRLDHFSRLVDMGCYERVPQGFMFNIR